ncbi:MAG: hypothetical protein GY832_04405 [Chloroflexi bacterium]|nr:hypothetical protein [Chloroflexota bacterium]
MPPSPNIGLAELALLAGLVALIVVIAVAAIVKRRKQKSDAPVSESRRRSWIWIATLILLVMVAVPVIVVIFGALLVTPVSRQSTTIIGPEPEITVQAVVVPVTTSDATPADLLPLAPTPDAHEPVLAPHPNSSAFLSLNPHNRLTMLVALPTLAGLVLLVGAVIVAAVLRRWPVGDTQAKDSDMNGGNGDKNAKETRLRYLFLTFIFWIALSIFLVFDLAASVSVYFKFTIIYAGFWTLVGALFLHDRPWREKLLILSLFLIAVFAIRFVDWNSRKPFLKDLYTVQEGMTPAQVEQIMGGYRAGGGSPFFGGSETELDEQGEIVTGGITYLHTDEGWGDSDWGVVLFEHGRVVRVEFLAD